MKPEGLHAQSRAHVRTSHYECTIEAYKNKVGQKCSPCTQLRVTRLASTATGRMLATATMLLLVLLAD
jgi:hypothetical protein